MTSTLGMRICFFLQVLLNFCKFQSTLEQRSPSNLNEIEWDSHNITKLYINTPWGPESRGIMPLLFGFPPQMGYTQPEYYSLHYSNTDN